MFSITYSAIVTEKTRKLRKKRKNVNCITNSKIAILITFFLSNLELNSLQAALYRYSPACPSMTFLSNP